MSATTAKYEATCLECGNVHEAEYSHEGRFGEGPVYAVVCTVDHLTSYYTGEVVHAAGKPTRSANLDRLALGVNCPHRTTCGASTDEPCRTRKGAATHPHTARIDRAVRLHRPTATN